MKTIKRIFSAVLLCAMLVLMLASCKKEPGIYAWWGGKMDADYILDIKVDGGDGEKTYSVPFDEYRTVFMYLKGITPSVVVDSDGETVLAIITDDEKTKAIKEYTENTLMEYYTLVALGEKLGITITDADRADYEAKYQETINSLINSIPADAKYDGTEEEYAAQLYRNSLALAGNMTPEYMEFIHYRDLLATRIKMAISEDLGDYLNQSYLRYKQVMILYTKGDSAAEEKAKADIAAVRERLLNGEDIDALAVEYDNSGYGSEVYLDAYGNIVGSSTGDSSGSITLNTINALEYGEISTVITGDDSDRAAYVAVYQRYEIEEEFACGKGVIPETLYNSPYVGASNNTPYYNRYTMLTDVYEQNMVCTPVNEKVYDRIAVDTLF